MFKVEAPSGPLYVLLRDPVVGEVVGCWRFGSGAAPLEIDFLDPVLCRSGEREVRDSWVASGFVSYPRMTFEVNGQPVELVSGHPEVLHRHYTRPEHQSLYNVARDPWLSGFHEARIRQVRRLLAGVTGRVADVGSGYSLIALAGQWPFQLYMCDRDPQAVRHIRTIDGATGAIGVAEAVPFRESAFDAVFAGEIIEHLAERQEALAGWVRLLRPGGRLVLTTPNRRHLMSRVTGHEAVQNPEHLFEYSLKELVGAVQAAGARVAHVDGLSLPLPVRLPGRGWRDLSHVVPRRWPRLPPAVLRRMIEAGRRFPGIAENLAVVAYRPD